MDRRKFKTLSNRERAEVYAEIKPHEIHFSQTPAAKWIHDWKNRSLMKLIGDVHDKIILDAGSGEGSFLSQIHAKDKYGIEMSKKRVQRALKHNLNLKLIIGDVKNLPFEDETLDVIVCSEVLEHVDNFQEAIHEFKRCLKKSGILVLSFPNEWMVALGRLFIWRFPLHEIDHVNWITPNDIKKHLGYKFTHSNVPPLHYPFCLYQVYKFKARDFKS